jgi:uncharacterized protein YkuJ
MLAQAYNDLPRSETYSISVRELCDALGYKGHNVKYIKQVLRELIGITVEWNVLGKDGTEEWGASSLLAEVKIINGICHYAYGPTMRDRLYNPTMYARISLSLQNKFNSKHSLALYELFVDYYDVNRCWGETPFVPVHDFRRLLGLKEEEYRAFKDLNRCIIKKALKEINEKSDLQVDVEYKKQGRVVAFVKFLIQPNPHKQSEIKPLLSRKEQLTLAFDNVEVDNIELFNVLVNEFGISANRAANILQTQDEFYIEEVLDTVRRQIELGKVQNIPAFTVKAIEDDYRTRKPLAEQKKEARAKAAAEARAAEKQRNEEQEAREQEIMAAAMSRYEKMGRGEQEAFLAEFREYLESTNNRILVERYDQGGITPGPVEGMFGAFVKERLGG